MPSSADIAARYGEESANIGNGVRDAAEGRSPPHTHAPCAQTNSIAVPTQGNHLSPDSAFDRLLSAALSTVIAILLAWRILILDDDKPPGKKNNGVVNGTLASSHATVLRASIINGGGDHQRSAPQAGGGCNLFLQDSTLAGTGSEHNTAQPWIERETPFGKEDEFSHRAKLCLVEEEPLSSVRRPLVTPRVSEFDSFPGKRSASPSNSGTSLSSLKLLLPCDDYTMEEPDETIVSEENALMILDDFDSDISSEHGALPAYLDTITEEDTDDLTSVSSGHFSPPSRIRAQATLPSPIPFNGYSSSNEQLFLTSNGFHKFESTDTITAAEDPGNDGGSEDESEPEPSVKGLELRVPPPQVPLVVLTEMDISRSPSPGGEAHMFSGVEMDEQPLPDKVSGESFHAEGGAGEINNTRRHPPSLPPIGGEPCSPTTTSHPPPADSSHRTDRADFSLFVTRVDEEDDENALEARQDPDSPLFPAQVRPSTTGSSPPHLIQNSQRDSLSSDDSQQQTDTTPPTVYHEFGDFPRAREVEERMEIDLKRVMERFARYGSVYGDARSSGMEEFNPKPKRGHSDSISSRSSSIASLGPSLGFSDAKQRGLNGAESGREKQGSAVGKNSTPPINNGGTSMEEEEAEKTGPLRSSAYQPGLTQQPVCERDGGAYPSKGTSSSRVREESDSSSGPPPPLPLHSPPHTPSVDQAPSKDNAEDSFFCTTKTSNESGTDPNDETLESSEGEIIVASASSQLLARGPEEEGGIVYAQASANAVSRNPYIALARATASAASNLHFSPPPERGGSPEKLSIVVATTVTASEKGLRSPKSKDFLANSSRILTDTSGMSSRPEPQPRFSLSPGLSKLSSGIPISNRTPAFQKSGGHALEGTEKSFPDSSDRKRPLLQQQSQHGDQRSLHSPRETQIPPPHPLNPSASPGPVSPNPSWQYSATDRAIMDEGTPKLSRTTLDSTPEPQRILPPNSPPKWHEEKPKTKVIAPMQISSENLARLIEEPSFKKKAPMQISSENLAKLIKEPTFRKEVYEKEKETLLSDPMHISSEHLQKLLSGTVLPNGETTLNQKNVALWETLPENSLNSKQNLMRWRNSCNLHEKEVLAGGAENSAELKLEPNGLTTADTSSVLRSSSPYSGTSATDNGELSTVHDLRNYQRKLADESMEEMRSSRRNKYKAKIEKARKDFIQAPVHGSISDLYKTREEFERKFKVSMEEVARPVDPPRGPLLAKFYDSEFKSQIDLKELPPAVFARMPESKYDKEYKSIVAEAEQRWAALSRRGRQSQENNLYTRGRAFSTGFLEPEEQALSELDKSMDTVHSAIDYAHDSRTRNREVPDARDAKSRARSVDYLMDEAAREAMQPPENQLQKILGEPSQQLSEHELRFRKSVEKLQVPNWYLEFGPPGSKVDPNRSYTSIATSVFTPGTEDAPQFPQPTSYVDSRPQTAQSNYQHLRDFERPAVVLASSSQTPSLLNQSFGGPERSTTLYSSDRSYQKRRDQPPPRPPKNRSKPENNRAGGVFIPNDLFDKYKNEIEYLRISRSSLRLNKAEAEEKQRGLGNLPIAAVRPGTHQPEYHDRSSSSLSEPPYSQLGRKSPPSYISKPYQRDMDESFDGEAMVTSTPNSSVQLQRKVLPPIPPPRPSTLSTRTNEAVVSRSAVETRRMEGYSVSMLPPEWNEPGNRDSRVIEVADTFSDPRSIRTGPDGRRIVGQVTLDEVLDTMLGLPSQRRLSTLNESSVSLESFGPLPKVFPETPQSEFGPGIFTKNDQLMHKVAESPEQAPELLKHEVLVVQCNYCGRTKELAEAKRRYVSCKHCYTYYCGRTCRRGDWIRHRDRCNFARINTLCKEIILKVREDPEAQWNMSRVARQGSQSRGRGSVNFRFRTPFQAETFVSSGWNVLSQKHPGNTFLYYYTVPDLEDGRKDPNLIALCRRYDPGKKFILSVSIIADIDECPETPFSQRKPLQDQDLDRVATVEERNGWGSRSRTPPGVLRTSEEPTFQRSQSLPYRSQKSRQPDARAVLKSVLRSMENIAPGLPPDVAAKMEPERPPKPRRSGGFNTRPAYYNSSSMISSAAGSRSQLFPDPTVV